MRYSHQLGSLVKNVTAELTLEEHQAMRDHVEREGKPASTLLRKWILKLIGKPRKKAPSVPA